MEHTSFSHNIVRADEIICVCLIDSFLVYYLILSCRNFPTVLYHGFSCVLHTFVRNTIIPSISSISNIHENFIWFHYFFFQTQALILTDISICNIIHFSYFYLKVLLEEKNDHTWYSFLVFSGWPSENKNSKLISKIF